MKSLNCLNQVKYKCVKNIKPISKEFLVRIPGDISLFLNDILSACKNIQDFIQAMDYKNFRNDKKSSSAVIRQFEIIGAAATIIPDSLNVKDFSSAYHPYQLF
jgi:hypothetical protein